MASNRGEAREVCLLKEVGFSLPKPHRRDYRQQAEKVREWREETFLELNKPTLDEARILVYRYPK